jgi:hypothetical protein
MLSGRIEHSLICEYGRDLSCSDSIFVPLSFDFWSTHMSFSSSWVLISGKFGVPIMPPSSYLQSVWCNGFIFLLIECLVCISAQHLHFCCCGAYNNRPSIINYRWHCCYRKGVLSWTSLFYTYTHILIHIIGAFFVLTFSFTSCVCYFI